MSQAVRVFVGWQSHHPQVQLVLQQQIDPSQGGFDSCAVAIVDQGDLGHKTLEQAGLFLGQGGSAASDHMRDPGLVERDDIHVPLDQVGMVVLGHRFAGLVEPKQGFAFAIKGRFG